MTAQRSRTRLVQRLLPWLNEVVLQRLMVAPGWWFGYHLIYGGMLFLVLSLARALGGRSYATEPALT